MANFELQKKWFAEVAPTNTNSATATIGSDDNGTITITIDDYGTEGNDYTIEVIEGLNGGDLSSELTNTAIVTTLGMSDAVASTCEVAAVSAITDILTTTANPATIGVGGNDLSINLTTAGDDNLAVSATGAIITIALADTTAANNTAALIQVAIRALVTVDIIDVSAFTCVAGGNWDTDAIATGESGAVDFTGGTDSAPDDAKNTATLITATIEALDDVSAEASGNGATAISTVVAEKSLSGGTYGTKAPVPYTMLFIGSYYYTNIAPNGKNDSNWRKFQLASY